jgi:hypothetical protein
MARWVRRPEASTSNEHQPRTAARRELNPKPQTILLPDTDRPARSTCTSPGIPRVISIGRDQYLTFTAADTGTMAGLKPHVPAIYRVAATGLGASMWFFVCIPFSAYYRTWL